MKAITYRQKLVIGACITVMIFILAYLSNFFSPYIHSFINIFAGGRSTSKVYVFLIYLFILFCIAIVKPNIPIFKGNIDRTKNFLLYTIGVLFLLGTIGLFCFMNRYGLNFSDYIAIFNNGEFSSTSIAHNHIGKGVIGYILSFLGYTQFEMLDAGQAFIGIIPLWFYVIFGIVLLITLLLTLLVFIKECYGGTPRVLYIVLYVILSFSVIEHTLDGGLFDPRVPILYMSLSMLLLGLSKARIKAICIIGGLSILLAIFYFKFNVISDITTLNKLLLTLIAYVGLLVIPFIFLYRKLSNRLKWLLFIFAFSLIIPFLLNADALGIYRRTSTITDNSYLAVYPAEKPVPYKVVDQYGDLTIYEVPAGVFKNVGEIINHYDLLDNILPVTVPWATCFPLGDKRALEFRLKTRDTPIKLDMKTPMSSTTMVSVNSNRDDLNEYIVNMEFNGCTPRYINALEEIIKSLGIKTFIISDIRNANNNNIKNTN